MAQMNTLISLAMLKVKIDQGSDYLEYFYPFVLQVLYDHSDININDSTIQNYIKIDFGLEIPKQTIQIILKRFSRKSFLKREYGVYKITENLPSPQLSTKKEDANIHIKNIISGLRDFSNSTIIPLTSDDEAVEAICSFLEKFSIQCLRAYLRGTAIPNIDKHKNSYIVLISKYLLAIQNNDIQMFNSFIVILTGHMIANALLCPDLRNIERTFRDVTFYFDTPLVIRYLGLEGAERKESVNELVILLQRLGAKIAIFSHSKNEIIRVIESASDFIDSPNGRGQIVMEARRSKTTKSDLMLIASKIDDIFSSLNITIAPTPNYAQHNFQIDEKIFESVLTDEVYYNSRQAKYNDINSVRSIYAIRSGFVPQYIEDSKAILVTSNSGFARAAFDYGSQHEESCQISSVIPDFSLANIAWLKLPMGAPNLPMVEILSFSYASIQPSRKLLEKYLIEIDKLVEIGSITERDHQLLKYTSLAHTELMDLTLGDELTITSKTISATLERITQEIKKEESDKLYSERENHHLIQTQLLEKIKNNNKLIENMVWRCRKRSKIYSLLSIIILSVIIILGTFEINFDISKYTNLDPNFQFIIFLIIFPVTIFALVNMLTGFSMFSLYNIFERKIFHLIIHFESKALGINLENFIQDNTVSIN